MHTKCSLNKVHITVTKKLINDSSHEYDENNTKQYIYTHKAILLRQMYKII